MFKNHIQEAKIFNTIIIENETGKKIYYDKIANYVSLFFKLLFTIGFFITIFDMYDSPLLLVSFIIFFLILLYDTTATVGRMIVDKPIFILNGDQLYYLKTNKWYNVQEYEFIDKFMGKYNFLQTFCMIDKTGNVVFSEKNWHLKNEDSLKYLIGYVKHLKNRKSTRRKRVR